MDNRRIRIGNSKFKLLKLTRDHKYICMRNHLNANEWLFVSETDSYLRIAKKDSLTGNPIVKNICKY